MSLKTLERKKKIYTFVIPNTRKMKNLYTYPCGMVAIRESLCNVSCDVEHLNYKGFILSKHKNNENPNNNHPRK